MPSEGYKRSLYAKIVDQVPDCIASATIPKATCSPERTNPMPLTHEMTAPDVAKVAAGQQEWVVSNATVAGERCDCCKHWSPFSSGRVMGWCEARSPKPNIPAMALLLSPDPGDNKTAYNQVCNPLAVADHIRGEAK